jgi:hypothetical protein
MTFYYKSRQLAQLSHQRATEDSFCPGVNMNVKMKIALFQQI